MAERKQLSNYVRFQVLKRDLFTCQYCGRSGVELEVDHIKPVSKGGTNDMDNLITSCKDCNRGKLNSFVIPEGYMLVPETKSVRMQLLIKPEIKNGIKKAAAQRETSMNDLLNTIMYDFLKKEGLME